MPSLHMKYRYRYLIGLPICMTQERRFLSIVRSILTDIETDLGDTDCYKCKLSLAKLRKIPFLAFITVNLRRDQMFPINRKTQQKQFFEFWNLSLTIVIKTQQTVL